MTITDYLFQPGKAGDNAGYEIITAESQKEAEEITGERPDPTSPSST